MNRDESDDPRQKVRSAEGPSSNPAALLAAEMVAGIRAAIPEVIREAAGAEAGQEAEEGPAADREIPGKISRTIQNCRRRSIRRSLSISN